MIAEPGNDWQALLAVVRALPQRRRRQLGGVLVLMFVGAGFELLSLGAVVPFLTLLAGTDGPHHLRGLWKLIPANLESHALLIATTLFMAAVIAASAARTLLQLALQRVVGGAGHELTVEIQRRSLMQTYQYHVALHSSSLIASLAKVHQLVHGVFMPILQAASAILISFFILAALARIEPAPAVLAAAFVTIPYMLNALIIRRRLVVASTELGATYDQRIRMVQESSGGIRDIIMDASQNLYLAAFRTIDLRFTQARVRIAMANSVPRFVIEAVGLVIIGGAAAWMADEPGGITRALPALGALALGGQRLIPLIHQVNQGWATLVGNRAIIRDIAGLLDLPMPPPATPGLRALPFEDRIVLHNVSFCHEGSGVAALTDIDLVIQRGSRTALVGRTGSGKTTLADLIMGLLTPSSGTITVDGRPLDDETIGAWHRNIAHVPQNIFLTDGSIARNVAPTGPDEAIDSGQLARAIRLAQLESFVRDLPDGIDTRIGERGARLSGGQRQRLGIARALYKQASFLVLDEATNALDEETETQFLSCLETLQEEGTTILVISHRALSLAGCDTRITLEDGRIASRGSYHDRYF